MQLHVLALYCVVQKDLVSCNLTWLRSGGNIKSDGFDKPGACRVPAGAVSAALPDSRSSGQKQPTASYQCYQKTPD